MVRDYRVLVTLSILRVEGSDSVLQLNSISRRFLNASGLRIWFIWAFSILSISTSRRWYTSAS